MKDHLKPLEVTTSKIGTGAVTESKIAREAVTASKIKEEAVTAPKIGDSQITNSKLQNASVTTPKIADGAVTGAKIASNAVTADKIANGAVTRDKISDGIINRPFTPPITTAEIGDNQVTGAKLQGLCVTTEKIADGAITGAKIAANTITQADIASSAVGTVELQDNSVTADKIQDGAVTPAKVETANAPGDGQVLSYEGASSKFKYVTPVGGLTRPISPQISTDEIGDAQVTQAKLSFTPATRPLSPRVVTDEIEDGAVTPAKLSFTPGGSKITLINPQTVFDETATTDRAAPIDIGAVVPTTAVGVLVELHQDGMVPSWAQPSTQIQHQLGGIALTCYITGNAAGNMPMYQDNAGIVPVYSPQNIYLVINRVGVSTRVKVIVTGYIE